MLPRVFEQVGEELAIGEREDATPTAASRLPHHTFSHASGARSTAVRMPPSSSITFIRSSLQSVAKILPPTRNDGRP